MFKVRLESIIIPEYMTPPNPIRLSDATRHAANGTLFPLQLEQVDNGFLLRKGYARYLGALASNLEEVNANIIDPIVLDKLLLSLERRNTPHEKTPIL